MTALTLKASMKLSLLAALLSAAAHAQPPDRTHLRAVSVAELKAIYLECDQAASTMVLDFSTAIDCSMVSEELLERGFGWQLRADVGVVAQRPKQPERMHAGRCLRNTMIDIRKPLFSFLLEKAGRTSNAYTGVGKLPGDSILSMSARMTRAVASSSLAADVKRIGRDIRFDLVVE